MDGGEQRRLIRMVAGESHPLHAPGRWASLIGVCLASSIAERLAVEAPTNAAAFGRPEAVWSLVAESLLARTKIANFFRHARPFVLPAMPRGVAFDVMPLFTLWP